MSEYVDRNEFVLLLSGSDPRPSCLVTHSLGLLQKIGMNSLEFGGRWRRAAVGGGGGGSEGQKDSDRT